MSWSYRWRNSSRYNEEEEDTPARRHPKQVRSEDQVDFNSVLEAGGEKKCVEKVVLEQETEWTEEFQCHHRYRQHCYTSYVTAFNPIQEEECNDNYKKNCFIEYGIDAINQTVKICKRPLVKDCSVRAEEEVCRTHYETECWTKTVRNQVDDDVPECLPVVDQKCVEVTEGYTTNQQCSDVTRLKCSIKKQVSWKYSPVTECRPSPVEICGPADCGVRQGPEICYDKQAVVVYDKPEETCNLESFKTCQFVTKLVPHLKGKEKCVDIPLEICVRQEVNPRKVNKPVITVWCYKASPESGLAK